MEEDAPRYLVLRHAPQTIEVAKECHGWHHAQESFAEEGEYGKDREGVRLEVEKMDVIMAEYGQEEFGVGGNEPGDDGVEKNWLQGARTPHDDNQTREDPGHAVLIGRPGDQRKNSSEALLAKDFGGL